MKRMAFLAVMAMVGCGGAAEQLDQGESDDVIDTKADGASKLRLGSYDLTPSLDIFFSLELDQSGAYRMMGGCRPSPNGPSCLWVASQTGHYRLTRSGTTKYIRLYKDDDQGGSTLTYRLKYTVSGDQSQTVKLSDKQHSVVATLLEADKSQEGELCGGFAPSIHPCATGLTCQAATTCCDMPGTCVRP